MARGFVEGRVFMSMHRHTGQGSAATADPVSSATVKRRSLLPLSCENKEQNASRFGICAGFRLGARDRSLGRNDAESLGFGRNEQPWLRAGVHVFGPDADSVIISPKVFTVIINVMGCTREGTNPHDR